MSGMYAGYGWGAVPGNDRLTWARYLVEYPPVFPGAAMMCFIVQGIAQGRSTVPPQWSAHAARLHALGFTPVDFMMLQQDLDLRRARAERDATDSRFHAAEDDRPDLFEEITLPSGSIVVDPRTGTQVPRRVFGYRMIPEKWSAWPLYVRDACTPHRATEYVLTDGHAHPLVNRTGEYDVADEA